MSLLITSRQIRRFGTPPFLGFLFFATLALVAITNPARAQDVLLATSANADTAPVSAGDPTVEVNPPLPLAEGEARPTTGDTGAVPRRFRYSIGVGIRGVYDDNINVSHSDRISDFTTAIEPRVMIGLGDSEGRRDNFLRLDYSPSLFLYVDHDEANAIQQLVHLEGQYQMSRLTLNLSQDIQILDGTNLDVATTAGPTNDRVNLDVSARTRVNIFTTRFNAAYYLAGKTFLSGQLGATINDYSTLISSESYSGNLFVNYVYSSKLTVGVGGGGGYNFVSEPSPDQMFEQISARLNYQLSGKVAVAASGGAEFRQSPDGGSGGTYVSPVFEIGATYMPFDGTTFTLTASRRTQNSAVLAGQDFSNTSIIIGARQRFLQRIYFGLSAGFENSEYFSASDGVSLDRSDNYFFLQPSIDLAITRFWTVGAYYLHRESDSSVASFSFYDNQIGLRTALTF